LFSLIALFEWTHLIQAKLPESPFLFGMLSPLTDIKERQTPELAICTGWLLWRLEGFTKVFHPAIRTAPRAQLLLHRVSHDAPKIHCHSDDDHLNYSLINSG
jgi:hypothetical protein